jgi:hypothetical protein
MKTQRLIPKKYNAPDINIRRAKWKRLHDILGFTPPLCGILSAATNNIHLDLQRLEKLVPNYNGEDCTYKGKPKYSMSMAVKEEWGEEAVTLIKELI